MTNVHTINTLELKLYCQMNQRGMKNPVKFGKREITWIERNISLRHRFLLMRMCALQEVYEGSAVAHV